MKFKSDIFEPEKEFIVEEAISSIEGQPVLCKVKGTFFVPDGTSRNKRFYPKSLWEKAINKKEIKEKLDSKRMFGTIGHDQAINDAAILEGKISHIVTDLRIDESGNGVGEALILDTPAGRGLSTLLKAGSKLFVSSRAMGKYKGEKNGLPVVDEDSYDLQTFDFVIDPGFLEANPSIKESLEKVFQDEKTNNKESTGESKMDDAKLAQHIMDENTTLKTDLNNALTENRDLQDNVAVANDKVRNLEEEIQAFEEVKEILEEYKALGDVESIKEKLEEAESVKAELAEWKAIDEDIEGPQEIIEATEAAIELIKEYRKVGSTPEVIREALEELGYFREEVLEYGTLEDIEKLYKFAEEAVTREKELERKEGIASLAKELGVSETRIEKVYGKLSDEEIRETFSGLKTDADELKNKYTKNEVDLDEDNTDEDDDDSYSFEVPLAERLMNIK